MYSVLNKLSEYIHFYISKKLLVICLFLKSAKAVSVSLNTMKIYGYLLLDCSIVPNKVELLNI